MTEPEEYGQPPVYPKYEPWCLLAAVLALTAFTMAAITAGIALFRGYHRK